MNLYKVSQSTGKMQVWSCHLDGIEVVVIHGQHGGKMQESRYKAEPKNMGRSNETTSREQAIVERDALYVSQQDNKHYRYAQVDARALAGDCKIPRKVHNFKDHGSKMSKGRYSSIKKNGSRACVIDGNLYSKIGKLEEVKVKHIREAIEKLGSYATFDAEVYSHGLSLQRIRAAWTKPVRTDKEVEKVLKKTNIVYDPNEDALGLQLHVFDIPIVGVKFKQRISAMKVLEAEVIDLGLEGTIKFIYPEWIESDEERRDFRDCAVSAGYEGLVHYEEDDLYEFGKRSYTCQKDKPRYDAEAQIIGVEPCKNGDGKLVMKACEELEGVQFKCMMKVDRRDGEKYPRKVADMTPLIGQWITFSYEELSDKGVPTKPVGEEVRKCDEDGVPLE